MFTSKPVWPSGASLVRIIVGIFLIIHGFQAMTPSDMEMLGGWIDELGIPFPLAMTYIGKAAEFFGGICLVLGVFTRPACVFLIIAFSVITFGLGKGKIFTDSQHPFLFWLFSVLYLFQGPGDWSLSNRFKNL